MKPWKVALIAAGCIMLGAVGVAVAQRTNYLGTVFIADTTTPANQLKVNADGSINTDSTPSVVSLSTTSCSALCANLAVDAAAGSLYSFNVSADSTLSAAAWWIMVYNATSAPADGAVTPVKCYAMALGTTSYSAAFPTPVPFSTGITLGVSTTGCFTKTASTHAFISGDYK